MFPADPARYPWATVGTAFDYRLRFAFGFDPKKTVAAAGARKVAKLFQGPAKMPRAFEELVGTCAGLEPAGDRGRFLDEVRLARVCFALALYEQCFRTTPSRR